MLLGLLAAAGGLVLGSLLNVVASPPPAGGSLRAASRCPQCERSFRPRDRVPLVSWLLLRGRCRDCDEPISRRRPLVEALTGLAFVAVVLARRGDGAEILLGLLLVAFLVPLALIDLDTRRLPNRITATAAVTAVVVGTLLDASGEGERLLAAAAAGGFLLLAALANPRGLGLGDVKLGAVLGLFLGREVAAALAITLLAGVVAGIVVVGRRGIAEGRTTGVALGPLLALGGVGALLFGTGLVDAYLASF